ncbi:MAG TPA: hypothetical protein H9795_03130, partial [Candidatus Fournierella merdigallinarum]|nr:hypothetical protein [Candidatus Fournierella merdigallinarum]
MKDVNKTIRSLTAAPWAALGLALRRTPLPGRYALRFFAAMAVLTLVARGVFGASLARVSLTSPTRGTIVQKASVSATITAGQSEALALPAGVTVAALYVAAGQQCKEGEALVLLELEELQDALDAAKATRSQQEAQLARLSASTAADGSSVAFARQSLDRAKEDYARTDARTAAAVEEA